MLDFFDFMKLLNIILIIESLKRPQMWIFMHITADACLTKFVLKIFFKHQIVFFHFT